MEVSTRLAHWIVAEYGPRADEVLTDLRELHADVAGGQDAERIGAALVMGGQSEFAAAVELARTDWRDLLMAAGLAADDWPDRLDAMLSPSWTFQIRERSAGVYEGRAAHVTGVSIARVGTDPDDLLNRLQDEAAMYTGR